MTQSLIFYKILQAFLPFFKKTNQYTVVFTIGVLLIFGTFNLKIMMMIKLLYKKSIVLLANIPQKHHNAIIAFQTGMNMLMLPFFFSYSLLNCTLLHAGCTAFTMMKTKFLRWAERSGFSPLQYLKLLQLTFSDRDFTPEDFEILSMLDHFNVQTSTGKASVDKINRMHTATIIGKEELKRTDLAMHLRMCSICLNEYKPGDTVRALSSCFHRYHTGCIDKWLGVRAACPVCNVPAI